MRPSFHPADRGKTDAKTIRALAWLAELSLLRAPSESRFWFAWQVWSRLQSLPKSRPRSFPPPPRGAASEHQQTDDGAEGVGGFARRTPDGCSFFIDSTRSRLLMVVGMCSSANGLFGTVPCFIPQAKQALRGTWPPYGGCVKSSRADGGGDFWGNEGMPLTSVPSARPLRVLHRTIGRCPTLRAAPESAPGARWRGQ